MPSFSGYKLFLSPSIKPEPKDMADIVKCSGGEVLTKLPDHPGEGVLIVASPDDLSMLSTAVKAGVPVHSTELILSGVLRQELDLISYPLPPLPPHHHLSLLSLIFIPYHTPVLPRAMPLPPGFHLLGGGGGGGVPAWVKPSSAPNCEPPPQQ